MLRNALAALRRRWPRTAARVVAAAPATGPDVTAAPTPGHPTRAELTAFAELQLSQAEAMPIVTHVLACTTCRHAVVALVPDRFAMRRPQRPPTPQDVVAR
jgi:hypothetical protein